MASNRISTCMVSTTTTMGRHPQLGAGGQAQSDLWHDFRMINGVRSMVYYGRRYWLGFIHGKQMNGWG